MLVIPYLQLNLDMDILRNEDAKIGFSSCDLTSPRCNNAYLKLLKTNPVSRTIFNTMNAELNTKRNFEAFGRCETRERHLIP